MSKKATRRWREKKLSEDPEGYRALNAKKMRESRALHASYMRSWRKANPESIARSERKKVEGSAYLRRRLEQYGITPAEFFDLFEKQMGVCAICRTFPENHRYLCVDHDHQTNKVRGLLCKNCNLALGHLRDNAALALAAAMYLKRVQQ